MTVEFWEDHWKCHCQGFVSCWGGGEFCYKYCSSQRPSNSEQGEGSLPAVEMCGQGYVSTGWKRRMSQGFAKDWLRRHSVINSSFPITCVFTATTHELKLPESSLLYLDFIWWQKWLCFQETTFSSSHRVWLWYWGLASEMWVQVLCAALCLSRKLPT